MSLWVYDTILLISTFVFAFFATGGAYALMLRIGAMDIPNSRSNHTQPTPHGGGLGIVFAAICFMMVVDAPGDLIWGVLILAAVSFYDDIRPLPARDRFAVQVVVVAWMLATQLPETALSGFVFHEVVLLVGLAGLVWLWFINLFNFMDGSDGLAASEAACISAGIILMAAVIPLPPHVQNGALVTLGASLGFIVWNWHPARVFMGDVGSIPLGFLLGFLLLSLAVGGYPAASLILPAVFVADASLTLVGRMLRQERILEAHSSHAYQRAIRGGMTHDAVARDVIGVNIVLIVIAVLSTQTASLLWQLGLVGLAYGLACLLLLRFSLRRHPSRREIHPAVTEAEIVSETPARHTALHEDGNPA